MRITIKGNATAENFKEIVDSLNEEFAPLIKAYKKLMLFSDET